MAFFGLLILLSGFHPIVRVRDSAVQSFPKLHIKNSRGFPFPFFSMAASAVCSPPLPLDRINLLIEIIIYQTWKIYKFIIFSYIYRVLKAIIIVSLSLPSVICADVLPDSSLQSHFAAELHKEQSTRNCLSLKI